MSVSIAEYIDLYKITEDEARCLVDANTFMKTFGVRGSAYMDRSGYSSREYKIGFQPGQHGNTVQQIRYKTARGLLQGAKKLVLKQRAT